MARVCPLAERGLGRGAMKSQFGLSHILCSTQSAGGFNGQQVCGWLIGLNGHHWGEDFRLCEGSHSVGAGYDMDICLTNPGVSARHAKIQITPEGATINDSGSREGLQVNGQELATAQLFDGDELAFGAARFLFRLARRQEPGYRPTMRPRPAAPEFKTEVKKRLCHGWLVGMYGAYAGQDFRLLSGDNHFGTRQGIEISLVDAKLQPHAGYFAVGSGECVLIQGDAKQPSRRPLLDSDEVQIGSHQFYIKIL